MGNIDANLSQRKYQRGRTPEGAKLPKGVKAVTSIKPGETKKMSFYQLTADVAAAGTASSPKSEQQLKEEVEVTDGSESNESDRHLKYSLVLVDLPGFGFAFAKEEKAKEWNDLMNHYLLERRTLKRILLLLDARHGFKLVDFEFLEALQEGLKQQNSSSGEEDKNEGGRRRKVTVLLLGGDSSFWMTW
jgi:GTP-binding protein